MKHAETLTGTYRIIQYQNDDDGGTTAYTLNLIHTMLNTYMT